MICPICEKQIPNNVVVCPECGTSLLAARRTMQANAAVKTNADAAQGAARTPTERTEAAVSGMAEKPKKEKKEKKEKQDKQEKKQKKAKDKAKDSAQAVAEEDIFTLPENDATAPLYSLENDPMSEEEEPLPLPDEVDAAALALFGPSDADTLPPPDVEDSGFLPPPDAGDGGVLPPPDAGDGGALSSLGAGDGGALPPLDAGDGGALSSLGVGDGGVLPPLDAGDGSALSSLDAGDGSTLSSLDAGDGGLSLTNGTSDAASAGQETAAPAALSKEKMKRLKKGEMTEEEKAERRKILHMHPLNIYGRRVDAVYNMALGALIFALFSLLVFMPLILTTALHSLFLSFCTRTPTLIEPTQAELAYLTKEKKKLLTAKIVSVLAIPANLGMAVVYGMIFWKFLLPRYLPLLTMAWGLFMEMFA